MKLWKCKLNSHKQKSTTRLESKPCSSSMAATTRCGVNLTFYFNYNLTDHTLITCTEHSPTCPHTSRLPSSLTTVDLSALIMPEWLTVNIGSVVSRHCMWFLKLYVRKNTSRCVSLLPGSTSMALCLSLVKTSMSNPMARSDSGGTRLSSSAALSLEGCDSQNQYSPKGSRNEQSS